MKTARNEKAIILLIDNAIRVERINAAIESQTECNGLSVSFDLFTAIEWLMGFEPDPDNHAECALEDVIQGEFLKAIESDERAEKAAPKFYEIAKGLIEYNTHAPKNKYTDAIHEAVRVFLDEDFKGYGCAIHTLEAKHKAANTLYQVERKQASKMTCTERVISK